MKVFAVLVLCALAIAAVEALPIGEEKEAFRLAAQRCKTETGATDDTTRLDNLNDFRNWSECLTPPTSFLIDHIDDIIMHRPAASREAKCLRACLMKEVGIANAEGKLVMENVLKVAEIQVKGDPAKMVASNEIAEICVNLPVPDDQCEAAELYGKCFIVESEKRGILVDF